MNSISADKHVVIIGMGVAGVTFAKHLRKGSACKITLISDEHTTHFSRPALMYIYLGHMRRQDIEPYEEWWWKENNLNRIFGCVKQVAAAEKLLILEDNIIVKYDYLVVASGSIPRFYNWPGQELTGVQGFVRLKDLELLERHTPEIKHAVMVGGGLIGIELAEMLCSRNIKVTMLVRESCYWTSVLPREEAQQVSKQILKHGIKLKYNDELVEITGDDSGKVKQVKTKSGDILDCEFVGVATGVEPNISCVKNSGIHTDKGILVDRYFKTNLETVFAIGDCAQFTEPENNSAPIEQLWYTARMQAECLASNFLGEAIRYLRGPVFNSAKFIDIEYQTYGVVPAKPDDNLETLFWQDEKNEKLIRVVYRKTDLGFTGINLLGVRFRHDLCHHWLIKKCTMPEVLSQLHAACFDPEFSKCCMHNLTEQFYKKHPEQVPVTKQKNWWKIRKHFLPKNHQK